MEIYFTHIIHVGIKLKGGAKQPEKFCSSSQCLFYVHYTYFYIKKGGEGAKSLFPRPPPSPGRRFGHGSYRVTQISPGVARDKGSVHFIVFNDEHGFVME